MRVSAMAKKKATMSAASTPNKSTASRPTPGPTPSVLPAAGGVKKPAHDQVAKRAYEIWVAKGRPAGRDLENWQQAERELGLRK